jgi:Flp pilus assembly protein TadD
LHRYSGPWPPEIGEQDCEVFPPSPKMKDWMRTPEAQQSHREFAWLPAHKGRNLLALLMSGALLAAAGCRKDEKVPAENSQAYPEAVSDFYVGLAALQVGDDVRAESTLAQATQIAPGEPAVWANWGLLALRQRNFDVAAQRLNHALKLAPHNDRIYYLLGVLESDRGNSQGAIDNLRTAAELNPNDVRAAYALASEIERQGAPNSDAEYQRILQQILKVHPDNLAALLDLTRLAAKTGNSALLQATVAGIAAQSSTWPPEVKQQLTALQSASAGTDPHAAATRSIFLRNVLMRVPQFRESQSLLKPQPGEDAQPFTHLLRMESPSSTPAPADTAMSFANKPVVNPGTPPWYWVGAISLTGEGAPVLATANAKEVQLSSGAKFPFPGGSSTQLSPESVLPIDFNYDFKTDLVLAGAVGLRFMRQDSPASFTDVTAATKLPRPLLEASYTGAWAVDIEADGDLDIVLGAANELPTVLRNNGDGTFQPMHPFAAVSGIRQFVWADLNGDGNPDASLIDGSGKLHVFLNQRSGNFKESPIPGNVADIKAITAADIHQDGILALAVVQPDGTITRLSFAQNNQSWTTNNIAQVPGAAAHLSGDVRLRAADVDNNGAIDLILTQIMPSSPNTAGALIWLGDENGGFALMTRPAGAARVFHVADVKADGHMTLLGLSPDGQPQQAIAQGTKNYHWQIIRPRAKQSTGDQRINSFGIGGEIEIRSALLTQKQPIDGPQLHFGLGEHNGTEVARILWPNGSVRAEFALNADQQVLTEQRLKGSCPFLFAWNGKQMDFVKDAVPWGSAIGLRINSLGTASIAATEEWYKIRGDQLVAHDGYYDLRITGELWETYYYDHLALMVVDHPTGTDVFTDERFVVPAVKPAITTVATPHPILRATDDSGHDVTQTVRNLDGQYLDNFGRGQYQGVTRDHYVEVDLGDNIPANGPLYLIAKGWLHPSDSSINVAISQGTHEMPKPLSLEVVDGEGRWHVARANLGFPAGRKKICLIELTGLFRPGAPHKLRLRTDLEVYWDQIQWAIGLPNAPVKVMRLAPSSADLHYRGYSVIRQTSPSSPEIPDYNHLAATIQTWRDLTGYYTRYGDVRGLLTKTDDRYVIMNAGDEISLRFPAMPPPPAEWVRDYVIAGDGWIKDGDYNSTYSATVQPLPYHARKLYDSPPGRLEDEWVYRHHLEDWQTYQTRYVTPDTFENALRSSTAP